MNTNNQKTANKKAKPIFIVGNGRSGTTMLGQILTDSQLGKSFEGQFVTKALLKFGSIDLSEKKISELINLIEGFESAQAFNVKLSREKYTHRKNVKAIDIICDALNAIAEQANTNQWIEKTPYYVYNLPLILTYFPDARIIWMIRDGRDVANSVLQKSWGANNIYYAAKAWQSANKINHARVYDQVVKVKYEEFLQTPITELTKIMNFLGFRCDDIDSLVENVNPAKMNQWRHTLTAKQITVFEAVAFDTLKEHGYETLNDCKPKLSKISILIYRLEHHVKLLKHLIKMNLIHPVKIKLGILKPFAEKN